MRDCGIKNVISFQAKSLINAFVTVMAEVFSWGDGTFGILGHAGDRRSYTTLKRVECRGIGWCEDQTGWLWVRPLRGTMYWRW